MDIRYASMLEKESEFNVKIIIAVFLMIIIAITTAFYSLCTKTGIFAVNYFFVSVVTHII